MGTIRQHIPAFISGGEPKSNEFSSLEELFNIDWVKQWADTNEFHRFSLSSDKYLSGGVHLMAEYKEGTEWWVVGYISDDEITRQLPIWKPVEKKQNGADH